MKRIFVNAEGRLRSGWRVLVQFVGWRVALIAFLIPLSVAYNARSAWGYGLSAFVYILGGLGVTWIIVRRLDRRKFSDYGFRLSREWGLDLAVGLALGALIVSAVFAVEQLAGWVQVTSYSQTIFAGPLIVSALGILLVDIGIAFNEELVFRGYQLHNLTEGIPFARKSRWGLFLVVLLTSFVFMLMHLGSPNGNWLGWINITLAGVLLSWGYLQTGQLALPIGLHTAWNFFEEFVFGYPINGETPSAWLFGSQVSGPDLWTGGAFGPDGGLILTLMLLIVALLIAGWVRVRERVGFPQSFQGIPESR